jgi:hypothetical protein
LYILAGLSDADVLAAALLPLLTESGEYRAGSEAGSLLEQRLKRVAVVLTPWEGAHVSKEQEHDVMV